MTVLRGRRSLARAVRRAWSNRLHAAFVLVNLLPVGVRRPLARPVAAVAEPLARRMHRPATLLQLAFLAHWAAGRRDRAMALASELGMSPRSAVRGRRGLALLAFWARDVDAAVAIATTIADDQSPLALIRGWAAMEEGRYREAQEELGRGAQFPDAARYADRVAGILTTLQPDWRPGLGAGVARLEHLRGSVNRGRVLHLVAFSLPHRQAGYTVRTQAVAQAQRNAGLDPHVATRAGFPLSDGIAGAPRDELVDGIPYHHVAPDYAVVERPDRNVEQTARATIPLIEALRPAVLQPASNAAQAQVALALARPLGIPVVYEVRGFWEDSWAAHQPAQEERAFSTDRYRMTRASETAVMHAADAVVTLSVTMREELVTRGIDPGRITVVPNAVDVERFSPKPRDAALARSLGIDPTDVVAGYVSSLSHYEGIPVLLEAVALMRERGHRLRVLLVGDGEARGAIEAAGRQLRLDDGTLILTGRVPHERVTEYYALIDLFVVPRTADRVSRLVTPLKPYEAMAMERALVVSDVPALREMVIPGETGLVFRAGDATHLADVLLELVDDQGLRERLGQQACEWVRRERTWEQNGRRYRELFERLGVA